MRSPRRPVRTPRRRRRRRVGVRGGGQRDRRRIAQGLALLGTVLVLLLFGGVGGASAHAALTGTDPQDGSVLKTAPTEVTLSFSESIGLLDDSFRVLDPDNRRVHTGDPGHAGDRSDTARVTLPKGLGTGTFTVAWRVVSADSHPVSGAFTFSIGKPSATAPPVPVDPSGNTVAGTLYDAARYLAYGGLALLIGAATFVLVCGFPGPVRRLLLTGWWILAGSTVALLLLRGPYERGSGPADAFDPSVLSETLTSRPGLALLARLVLLGAAVFYPVREQARGRLVLALGGLLTVSLAVTWAVAEHASAGIQVPVAMVSSVLHLLSMAVWLGGLAALLTALYRSAEPLPAAVVNRFSRLALASVTVLVVTGVYQSWRGLGSWDALTSTSYGRLLLAKLVAVLVLLAGAGASRRWTGRLMLAAEEARTAAAVLVEERVPQTVGASAVPADVRVGRADGPSDGGPSDGSASGDGASGDGASDDGAPDPDHEPSDEACEKSSGKISDKVSGTASDEADPYRRALRRSVLVEVLVGIVVLVITTLLTGTQPGRAATEAAAASATAAAGETTASTTTIPFDVGTKGGHGKVQIELTPSRVGENSVQAVIYGPDGGFATVPELRLTFTLESQQIGPIDAELTDKGGYWAADGVTLPVGGTWTMKVTVRTTDIDQVTVSKTVKIS
ncbi:copper resistance protein CopC/CopD [Streptomyces mirabilis]|uniref:copper resistance CopC/CopD family protein n=1 Tax=Streptomyces mirabilis TaxID=68239 RepID=UPI00143E955E|nr:copper resistance protein CopC/CopD [Streptomyces sp. RLB1-33]QUW84975.1 copper resistance protein CopC/CopD [Streptomyces mirabilis]